MRCLHSYVLLALAVGTLGCGETAGQRLDRMVPNAESTTKVTGKVTVDGAPVPDLWVTLHPKNSSVALRPRGQTDKDGNFQMTTYDGGDGAPAGEYAITIEWLTYIKRASDWGGPDKLLSQYNDPKTTPFHVTVDVDPIQLPLFELKLAGVQPKASPTEAIPSRREK